MKKSIGGSGTLFRDKKHHCEKAHKKQILACEQAGTGQTHFGGHWGRARDIGRVKVSTGRQGGQCGRNRSAFSFVFEKCH